MFDKVNRKHRCYEFKSSDYYRPSDCMTGGYLRIYYRHVDYDGTNFGFIDGSCMIPEFRGRKNISSLPIFPLEFHQNKKVIRENLLATGRKFESMRGIHYMRYGLSIRPGEVEGVGFPIINDRHASD